MRSLLILLGALTAVATAEASAQDSAAILRGMEARLDSMAAARQDRSEALRKASTADTVAAGGLRIATSAQYRALAEEAGALAWTHLLERFGPEVLSRTVLPVQALGTVVGPTSAPGAAGELATGFARAAERAVWESQAPAFGPWLQGGSPGRVLSPEELDRIATDLATLPGRGNLECLQGLTSACLSMLGLGLGSDTLSEWYEPDSWPGLAGLVSGYLPPDLMADRAACVESGAPDACAAVLTPARLRPPVNVEGRLLLLQLALEAGGPRAFERITEPGAPTLEARLARAAGQPIDSLAVRWASTVRASAPRGPAAPIGPLALALGWSGGLLALALRGSRCR